MDDPLGKPAVTAPVSDDPKRALAVDALASAALAVSRGHGPTLFQELVRYLAATLEVECAFIASPHEDAPCSMRVFAFFLDGRVRENFEYPLSGTPCETVVGQTFRIYRTRLRETFPADLDFARLGFDSYAGFPLQDSEGRALGLISVVSRKPMAGGEFIESVLKIFAVRASAELERMRADEALRASEEQYRTIFNASEDGMILRDAESRVVDVNPAYIAITGVTREEIMSANWMPNLPADLARHARVLRQRALKGEKLYFEGERIRKDGTRYDCEVRFLPIQYRGVPHVLGIMRDVTARKRAEAERARLEVQLRQAQKMEAIGHLTGGIAHDFNNILTSVMGYLVLAAERDAARGDPKLARYLEQAQHSCDRAKDLIQQMLTFSRGRRGDARSLDLSGLVTECARLLRSTLTATMELQTESADDTPAVRVDPVHVDQILLNLCINARDAMGGAGVVRVSTRRTTLNRVACASCRQPISGTFAELSVRDSGPGVPPHVMDRMFDPFFTTKEVGKGSGMGLSTVHGIVHEYGGHIVVDSAAAQGAEFRILLPGLEPTSKDVTESDRADTGSGNRKRELAGRVLVVDDEESVREFMRDLLETWGLAVQVAAGGPQAKAMLDAAPDAVDLVITDQTMPRLTGLDLARHLRSRRRELPVILYSGYIDGLSEEQAKAAGVSALLRKPVQPAELFELLKASLPDQAAH
jgi:two-component system cell cycle sensor histidine kinase/response regulator CckA